MSCGCEPNEVPIFTLASGSCVEMLYNGKTLCRAVVLEQRGTSTFVETVGGRQNWSTETCVVNRGVVADFLEKPKQEARDMAKAKKAPKEAKERVGKLAKLVKEPLNLFAEWKGKRYTARLKDDGTFLVDGKIHYSPSGAGNAACPDADGTDFWKFWKFRRDDGVVVNLYELKGKNKGVFVERKKKEKKAAKKKAAKKAAKKASAKSKANGKEQHTSAPVETAAPEPATETTIS